MIGEWKDGFIMTLRMILFAVAGILFINAAPFGSSGAGTPFKYISSCEIDLNDDDRCDLAMLIETIEGRELIVLLRTEAGYEAFLLARKIDENFHLASHFGKTIRDTEAGDDSEVRRQFEVPGAYLTLYQPEGAATAYFWDGIGFTEVWVSD
jgi:hypothetical protein